MQQNSFAIEKGESNIILFLKNILDFAKKFLKYHASELSQIEFQYNIVTGIFTF